MRAYTKSKKRSKEEEYYGEDEFRMPNNDVSTKKDDVYSYANLDAAGLTDSQKEHVERYIETLRPGSAQRAVNCNVVSQQEKLCFTQVPPHYKYIDTFTNVEASTTLAGVGGIQFPQASGFIDQPDCWHTCVQGGETAGILQTTVNCVPVGTGQSQRVGRQIRLKRLQVRFFPIRCLVGSLDYAKQFSPETIRIVIVYDKQPIPKLLGNDYDGELIKMQLNTIPQSCNAAWSGDPDDYFRQSQQYIYGPLNQASRLRFIPLVDKVYIFPAVRVSSGGTPETEYGKYNCPDLKVIEYDIDLDGLLTQFKSDLMEPDPTFAGINAGHERLPESALATGALLVCIMGNTEITNNSWVLRGFTRVYYTDD
jgi:hypothetical protein